MKRYVVACMALLGSSSIVSAQYSYDFENLNLGDIFGQDGWVNVVDPVPEAGAVTIQSTRVSPVGGSTKALQFQRVDGQPGGVSRRVERALPSAINSGFSRVRWDLMMSARSNPAASNLFLAGLLFSGTGAAALNQIIQPYGQNGGGPGGAMNGFTDIDGLGISGYSGYNLVNGFLFPDTWYRFEMDLDWDKHTITNMRITDINDGTVGLPDQMGTALPNFGHPRLRWFFNNDGTNWSDQWTRFAFRASGMQGDPETEYLVIDNFAITPVNRMVAQVNLGDFTGNVAGQRVVIEVRDLSNNVLDRMAVAPESDGKCYFYTTQTGNVNIAVKGSHWLQKTANNVSVAGGDAGTFNLINGDCDGDNEVGIGDFAILSAGFGAYGGDPGFSQPDAGWNFEADLDGDNEINIGDYAILSANFGQIGDD